MKWFRKRSRVSPQSESLLFRMLCEAYDRGWDDLARKIESELGIEQVAA